MDDLPQTIGLVRNFLGQFRLWNSREDRPEDAVAEYARLDTLPAVRWTVGAPPEDMRDGRDVLVWCGHDCGWTQAYWNHKSGRWFNAGFPLRLGILAWADPQPPEGV